MKSHTVRLNINYEISKVKSSHLHLNSAFDNTDCFKEALQWLYEIKVTEIVLNNVSPSKVSFDWFTSVAKIISY